MSHTTSSPLRRLSQAAEGLWQETIFAIAGLALRAVPLKRRLGFAQRLRVQVPLDYPRTPISMLASSPKELQRSKECAKEPETVAWMEASLRAGDVFYDIGSNTGAYAMVAATLVGAQGRVVAFEPGAATFASLVANLNLNAMTNVVPLPLALSDRNGLIDLHYPAGGAGVVSSFEAKGGSTLGHPALCGRLDDFVTSLSLRLPNAIKMDTDQTEDLILQGATTVLASDGLRTVLIEVALGSERAELIERLLADRGFALTEEHRHGSGAVANRIYRRL